MDDNFDLSGEEEGADVDEEDDSQEASDEDAELAGTDAKRAAQASGSHPLQQSFKAAAGELLKKYGIATDDAGRPLRPCALPGKIVHSQRLCLLLRTKLCPCRRASKLMRASFCGIWDCCR